MVSIERIVFLLQKELILEWRNKSLLASMLIYVIGASFIVYFAFQGRVEFQVWSAMFWIIIMFSAVNILGKSFDKEVNNQYYYIRSVIPPLELIFSKLIYNTGLLVLFELIIYLEMALFFGIEIEKQGLFFLTLLLGGIGFSNLFTLFSTITARTGNAVLLSVLGFPLILPLLLLILRLTGLSEINDITLGDQNLNLASVAVLDIITWLLSVVLFPYLWNE